MVVIGGGKSSNLCSEFFFAFSWKKTCFLVQFQLRVQELKKLNFSFLFSFSFRVQGLGIGRVDDPNKGSGGEAPSLVHSLTQHTGYLRHRGDNPQGLAKRFWVQGVEKMFGEPRKSYSLICAAADCITCLSRLFKAVTLAMNKYYLHAAGRTTDLLLQ